MTEMVFSSDQKLLMCAMYLFSVLHNTLISLSVAIVISDGL